MPADAASLSEASDSRLVATLKAAVESGQWETRNAVITEFYNRYAENLAATWLRRAGDPDQAGEVLQETFTRATEKLHTIGDERDVLIWLRTTARNHWLDRKRREVVEGRHEELLPQTSRAGGKPAQGPEERLITELDRAKTRSVFERYLRNLSPQDREIMARRIRGLQMPEICAQLGISDKECRRAYARIRFLLQKMRLRGFTLEVSDLLGGAETGGDDAAGLSGNGDGQSAN